MEGKESATEKVTLSKEKLVEFFFVIPQITLCSVQASNRDLVKEKGVEGKEAATMSVTSLKEAAVEKVNSMKENADDGVTNSPVLLNSQVLLNSPVLNSPVLNSPVLLKNSDVFNLCKNGNMILFYMALVVIMMTTLQALEATWFGIGSSGKGELDESQVSTKRSSS